MGQRVLLDTNVVLDYMGNKLPDESKKIIAKIIDAEINLSIINKIELLGFSKPDHNLTDFVKFSNVFPLDDETVDKTILIRSKYKIKLPDAIIAATAIVNNLTLITRNTRDFDKIEGLKVIDPMRMQDLP